MAEVTDVDPDLQPLARRVPVEARSAMSRAELTVRLEYAASLLGDAETARDGHAADRLKAKAEKVLKAMSGDAYAAEHTRLDNELADAHRRGDDQAAYAILGDIHRLEISNPQPPADRFLAAATAALISRTETRILSLSSIPRWGRGKTNRRRK